MPRRSSAKGIENIRHSLAHLLAVAVLEKFPKAKLGIGPAIENGFYYDFEVQRGFTPEDLRDFEKSIRKYIKSGFKIEGKKITPAKAKKLFSAGSGSAFGGNEQPFRLELINDFEKDNRGLKVYSILRSDPGQASDIFTDLCRGGHVKNTNEINPSAFKLTSTAGAYWKGNENNPQLQRIYGVAFETKKELDDYIKQKEEAEKRDHRKLGRELDLFTSSELVGPGLPLFTPKGTTIRRVLTDFVENLEREAGYEEVWVPHLTKPELYKISGHLDKFGDDLFYVRGVDSELVLKPMNCPHHIQIYKSKMRSYKDLPIRYFETSTVYRDEQTGELGGLTRVRSITQDDGHVFFSEDQLEEEFGINLKIQQALAKAVGFKDYWVRLSLRDEKNKKAYLGDDKTWQKAQKEMEAILKKKKVNYVKAEGEAAFYGPKMDFMARDSLGREWQFSTIQLDLNMPKRFGAEYIDKDGSARNPLMIHRAFMGSVERFVGILIEHYAGAFPMWLSPVQVQVLPVSQKHNTYAKKVFKELDKAGIRAELTSGDETIGKRIREGETQKIPYILVVGEKEAGASSVAVRKRGKKDISTQKLNKFVEAVTKEIEARK